MKFKCGMTSEERKEKFTWKPFYPWWPRQIAPGDCRCFEWIERQYDTNGYDNWWNYRLPPK